MPPKHETQILAEMAKAEINSMAKRLGPQLLGSAQPDAHRVDREQYLAYVRHSWWFGFGGVSPEEYRNKLLGQIGADQFMALAKDAWDGHEDEYQKGQMAAQMMAAPPIPPTGPMPAPPPIITQGPPPQMAPAPPGPQMPGPPPAWGPPFSPG